MAENEKVEMGKFVAISYKLYDAENGKLLFEAKSDAPDTLIYGLTHEVVPGLVEALKGLKDGDKFDVTIKAEAAFGPRYEENVIKVPKDAFMRDGALATEVTVGAELPMLTNEGFRILGRVLEITKDYVTMDFNHPFAGKDVRYEGEVIEVRPATPEELSPKSCGCGCHGGCDDGCDHDHGDCCDHDHGDCCGHDHGDCCGCGDK